MGSYTQIIYQIVFSTKYRLKVLTTPHRHQLFDFIGGILKNKRCFIYCINGVEEHIHIVCNLHPSVSLASLVKDIKLASSAFIYENKLFSGFEGWQTGYRAFTYTIKEKERLIAYVKNQAQHHKRKLFKEEYIELLKDHGIQYEEKYVFE
ncbi:MAG: IS200/IS605 family transposase [Bacteroidia bacterium]